MVPMHSHALLWNRNMRTSLYSKSRCWADALKSKTWVAIDSMFAWAVNKSLLARWLVAAYAAIRWKQGMEARRNITTNDTPHVIWPAKAEEIQRTHPYGRKTCYILRTCQKQDPESGGFAYSACRDGWSCTKTIQDLSSTRPIAVRFRPSTKCWNWTFTSQESRKELKYSMWPDLNCCGLLDCMLLQGFPASQWRPNTRIFCISKK